MIYTQAVNEITESIINIILIKPFPEKNKKKRKEEKEGNKH